MKIPEKYSGLLYLAMLVIVVPYLAWSLAVSGTVGMWRSARRARVQIELLEGDVAEREPSVPGGEGGRAMFEGPFMENIHPATEKYGVEVVRFTPYVSEKAEGAALHTAELVLGGGYAGLVRMIEYIENDTSGVRLLSVVFKTSRRDRSRPAELTATLILQQIITDKP